MKKKTNLKSDIDQMVVRVWKTKINRDKLTLVLHELVEQNIECVLDPDQISEVLLKNINFLETEEQLRDPQE